MAARIRSYEPNEIADKKTISTDDCCDLKVETTNYRVWYCREQENVRYQSLYQNKWLDCNSDGSFR